MKRLWALTALLVSLSINGAAQTAARLHGVVTDPSGASVPGALVQLRGPGVDQRASADASGKYAIEAVKPGKYTVRFIAKGFTSIERKDVEIVKRSEEHTSELQSLRHLVCRLLLEKKFRRSGHMVSGSRR